MAQRGHILVVLLECAGEAMVASAIADTVVKAGCGWMHGGLERAFAGIRNWPWGQASVNIGIVKRVEPHIVMMKRAAICALEQLGVNHAGVGLQRDMFGQTVHVHTSHFRTLFRNSGFLLDDRSQSHSPLNVCIESKF